MRIDSRGAAVLLSLITLASFITAGLVFLALSDTEQKYAISTSHTYAREGILFQLLTRASNPTSMALTVAASAAMTACENAAVADCTHNVAFGVELKSGTGISVAGPEGGAPVRYTRLGEICTGAASVRCPFEAYASVKPRCSGGTATCNQAYDFEVAFRVIGAPGVVLWGAHTLKELQSSVFILRSTLAPVDERLPPP